LIPRRAVEYARRSQIPAVGQVGQRDLEVAFGRQQHAAREAREPQPSKQLGCEDIVLAKTAWPEQHGRCGGLEAANLDEEEWRASVG
jgi:hypothetical protein